MADSIISIIVGICCIVIGILNTRGNISFLHSYHRHRVTEEDRIPFGRQVGLGTIIIGCAITISGILLGLSSIIGTDTLAIIGTILMIAGLAAGLFIVFRAMFKYNKGIF
ncbi:MAG: hypothetical protein II225_01765 [Ruminococcus sp.]|nr:hypothetical protein [Ruminococcus sp.]